MGRLTTSSAPTSDTKSNPQQQPQAGELPPHLQKAMSRITEISSLPEITTKIVQVVEDPRATAQDMHDIVKNDPALATKILKVVNSAFYGLPSQIASLDRAIVMLGLSAVKNIALAASLSRLFKPGRISDQFEAKDLWRHCIAVGVCSRMLLKAFGSPATEEVFVAGLVHDLGLLVEYQLLPEMFRDVVNRASSENLTLCDVEKEIIGVDHQMFGAALAARWKFPPVLRSVISHHHNPMGLKPEFQRVAMTIRVADIICCKQQVGFWLPAYTDDLTTDMLTVIGVGEDQIHGIVEKLPEEIEEVEAIFGKA